ncbi:hypothetical protein ACFL5O_01725 [Myxococcota bacterium]
MERRVGLRARTDFRVTAQPGYFGSCCRGIEVSATGLVIDPGRWGRPRGQSILIRLELHLPERMRPLRALARPIWSLGPHQAMRFVSISDVDRLTLAEHLDWLRLRGVPLA